MSFKTKIEKRQWPKLPEDFKKKLISQIEMGNIRNVTGALAKPVKNKNTTDQVCGYCILGLAAHLCGVPDSELVDECDLEKFIGDERYEIPEVLISAKEDSLSSHLMKLNDDSKYGFKRMAKFIEKNL